MLKLTISTRMMTHFRPYFRWFQKYLYSIFMYTIYGLNKGYYHRLDYLLHISPIHEHATVSSEEKQAIQCLFLS